MNRSLCFAACVATTALIASVADARPSKRLPSWYLGLSGGVSYVQDATLLDSTGAANSGTLNFDQGYSMNAALGYRPRYTNSFADYTRWELELGLSDNEIDSASLNGGMVAVDGDVQVARLMANMYIDLPVTQQWRPYLGGGVGVARVHAEQDEDTVLAWQGMAGLYYTPESFPAAEIGGGYRYLKLSDPKFTDPALGSIVEIEYDAHLVEAGVRLYF
jgi:opacity protein-like surface antigen